MCGMEIFDDEEIPKNTPELYSSKSIRKQIQPLSFVETFSQQGQTQYFKDMVAENELMRKSGKRQDIFKKVFEDYAGKDAINKLLIERNGYIPDAFYRGKIGYIGLLWGDVSKGLLHFIRNRLNEGKTGKDIVKLLNSLEDTICYGKITVNKKGRYEIRKQNKVVVVDFVSIDLNSDKKFILTAFFED
jgi:hypothetical protein